MVAFEQMTVVQLKERLAARGLPKTGNKADLIARLRSKKSPAKKSPAKKSPAKKAKKSPAKKSPAKKITASHKKLLKEIEKIRNEHSKAGWTCSTKKAKKRSSSRKPERSPAKKATGKAKAKKTPAKKGKKTPAKKGKCPEFSVVYAALPDDRKKVIKEITFPIGQGGGHPYHILKFTSPKTELGALKEMMKFMSVKIDQKWADKIGEDFEEIQDMGHYCNRGDLLQDHRIFEGSDIKGSKMFVDFGS